MRREIFKAHSMILLTVMTLLGACVSEKKSSTASCGELEVFDSRTQSCKAVSNPRPALTNLTVLEDSGANVVELSYKPPNGAIAVNCSVSEVYNEIEIFSPLRSTAETFATDAAVAAANAATLMTAGADKTNAESFAAIAKEQAAIAGVAKTQTQLVTALNSVISNANSAGVLAEGQIGSAPAGSAARAKAQDLNNTMSTINRQCQCSAGRCTAVVIPQLDQFGVFDFSYSITDSNGKTGTTSVGLTVKSVNDKPIAGHLHVSGAESNSSTPSSISFTIPLARDVENDLSIFTTYSISTNPSLGLVTNCLDAPGSTGPTDRTCSYTPLNGNLFGQGALGSSTIQDVRFDTITQWTQTYSFTLAYKDFPLTVSSQPIVEVTDAKDVVVFIDEGVTTAGDVITAISSHKEASSFLTATLVGSSSLTMTSFTALTLTPSNGAFDVFYYVANDGSDNSATPGVVSIEISPTDDLPLGSAALTNPLTWNEDAAQVVTLSYSDVESDVATSCDVGALTNLRAVSSCTCTAGVCSLSLLGDKDYAGAASFQFSVSYSGATSLSTTTAVTISDVNDLPVPAYQLDNTVASVESSTSVPTEITFTVNPAIDPDDTSLSYTVVTAPVNGSLTNCMNLTGSSGSNDLTCSYTPVNGNVSGLGATPTATIGGVLAVEGNAVTDFGDSGESSVQINIEDGVTFGVTAGSEIVDVTGELLLLFLFILKMV